MSKTPQGILQEGRLILASASPRRRELLRSAGYDFDVVVAALPEPQQAVAELPPADQAKALAYFKARAVARNRPAAVVLAADTVVAMGDDVLGKPCGAAEARAMLGRLSGSRHAVITGVAVVGASRPRLIASEMTYVTMRPMSPEEIEAYVASGEWRDKAGAYAIQETADRFILKLEGSFTNVVGLPMELTARALASFGVEPAQGSQQP